MMPLDGGKNIEMFSLPLVEDSFGKENPNDYTGLSICGPVEFQVIYPLGKIFINSISQ